MRPEHRPLRLLTDLAVVAGSSTPPGAAQTRVTGVAVGSADVLPGDLFVGVPGLRVHGARFAAAAVAAGAVAVLTDADGAALAGADLGVPVLVTDRPLRALLGEVSAWCYGYPARELTVVGITGTNGKTTTTYFVDAALRTAHETTAVVGTVELRVGSESIESPRTTVEAPVLHGLFALMAERGASACSMEVSSHALALERVAGLTVDVAAFTNLQRDHLDFHGDMEGYFRDKSRLFAPDHARRGVICVDDEWGLRLAVEARIPVETLATREASVGRGSADWRVEDATIGLDGVGSTFTLVGPDDVRVECFSPLPGLVNVSNAALAIVVAQRAGIPLADAVTGVAGAHAIPGRMERVVERGGGWPLCLVDYAHTPDALVLALEAVRPITPGRLVLVLGSDGDRDRGKRPIMGEVAARLADVVVVTDENPRSEPPETIRAAILAGAHAVRPDGRDILEAAPRADAVRLGMLIAGSNDTVIVTGKGHEPTQEIAGVFHRYNDREVYLAVRDAGRPGTVHLAPAPDVDAQRAALHTLRRAARGRRTVAVVASPAIPTAVTDLDALGRLAVRLDVRRLLAVGAPVRAVHTGAYQEGSWDAETAWVPDVDAAREWLAAELRPDDVVLVTGAGLDALAADLAGGAALPLTSGVEA